MGESASTDALGGRLCMAGLQSGKTPWASIRINWAINCTSPTSNFAALQHPLIANLRSQQLICPDPLKLGLRTAANGALLNAGEIASSFFFTLGSPRKADLWESIAVPEIRVQALALAAELLHLYHQTSIVRLEQRIPMNIQEFNDNDIGAGI